MEIIRLMSMVHATVRTVIINVMQNNALSDGNIRAWNVPIVAKIRRKRFSRGCYMLV